METKAIGFQSLHGKEKIISMVPLANNFPQTNNKPKISQFMFPTFNDMEVEVAFNPIHMNDMVTNYE